MLTVKESSSEDKLHEKKRHNRFSLQLSTTLFVVPTKGSLNIELKNVARKSQEVLINLESAIFTIKNFDKELFPLEQKALILNPSETKSFTICVKEHFPESFDFENIRLETPEGQLTIAHCDTKRKNKNGNVELDKDSNGMMCLAVEKDEKLKWGSMTQKIILDIETKELKEQKERYFREREDYENKKSGSGKQSSKESGSDKEKSSFECCCMIS